MQQSEWEGKPLEALNAGELGYVIASPVACWKLEGVPTVSLEHDLDITRAIAARLLLERQVSEPGALR